MSFIYSFPAVKGIQAGKEYYISMVPLKLLPKLFPKNDDYVLPEYRAQRKINENRIPEIKNYILNNKDNYVFSALSASIDGKFVFKRINNTDAGVLEINMDSVFLINDGQHRKAAIEEAIIENKEIENETISIVFFKDKGLLRSQQMFTDLNKHAVKSSNSLSTLYDSRDDLAMITKKVISEIDFFRKYTDKERDILGKNSSKLFTLSTIYKANQKMYFNNSTSLNKFIIKYWRTVSENIVEWNELEDKEISKKDLREDYIITLSVTIISLGRLGGFIYKNNIDLETLTRLKKIDWSRNNTEWKSIIIRKDGRVINTEEATMLAFCRMKQKLKLSLTLDEKKKINKIEKEN